MNESVKSLTEQLASERAALEPLKKEKDEEEEVQIQLEPMERPDRLQENESKTRKVR